MRIPVAAATKARALFVPAIAIFLCLLPTVASTSPGDLDPTFGVGGKVTTDFRGFYDNAFAAALQSDGKIVVAGESFHDDSAADFALARYNTDGRLDTSFGSEGKVITPIAQSSGASCIAIQPDGKLLVGGSALVSIATKGDWVLARYNRNGTLDASFGTGGVVTVDFFGENDNALSMAFQADGKIILGGVAGQETQFLELVTHLALVRYTPDGGLDTTFGSQGKVVADFSTTTQKGAAGSLAVDAEGRILVGGGFLDPDNVDQGLIARFNPNGTLDTSFGTGGSINFHFGFGGGLRSLTLQPDGNILALTEATTGTSGFIPFLLAVVRLKPTGAFDKTFGDGGHALADFGFGTYPGAMALAPDGKIVAVGTALVNADSDTDFAVARFLPNGTLDSSFGAGGKVRTDFFGSFDVANAVVVRPDGRTVVIGFARNSATGNDFALATYQGPHFDTCLQDDSSGDWLTFDSQTGEYLFTACGSQTLTVAGAARIRVKKAGCVLKLSDTTSGRALSAMINLCSKTGSASVEITASGRSFTITDSSTANDTCSCAHP